jgi:Transglycosylase SLT domain
MNKILSNMKMSPARLVLADIWLGMRQVSHNAFALLGLSTVVAVTFLLSHADMRHQFEARTLGWLADRAFDRLPQGLTGMASQSAPQANILPDMAEPDAIARATATDPAELNRQQSAVVNWIARRYAVAPEPIGRLAQEAWSVGRKAGLDPTLILAIMAIESGFNPFAQSHVGAQGLMQVMTTIHQDKYEIFGGRRAAFDPVTNLRVGVQVLKDCIARAGSLEQGLKHYVGAANLPHDGGYAAKVLAEHAYLQEVMAGRKVATTAPLPQFSGAAAQMASNTSSDGASVSVATQAAELIKQLPAVTRQTDAAAAGVNGAAMPSGPAVIRMTPVEPAVPAASEPSLDAIDHVAMAN